MWKRAPARCGAGQGSHVDRHEIVAFWHACDGLGEPIGQLLKRLLLTGCRHIGRLISGEPAKKVVKLRTVQK